MKNLIRRRQMLASLAGLSAGLLAPGASLFAQTSANATLDRIRRTKVVRIGWAIYYPEVFRDPATNAITGLMVDYMALMGSALGARVEWVEDNTATLIAGLQADKFDLTLPLGITEARARAATFPTPLIAEGLSLLSEKSRLRGRNSWQAYDQPGTTISVTLGSNSDVHVSEVFKKAEIVRMRSEADGLAQLLVGRVDAKAIGRSAVRLVMKQRPEVIEVPNSTFFSSPMSPALRKGDTGFSDWISEFSETQKKNGNLLAILTKYGLDDSFIWRGPAAS